MDDVTWPANGVSPTRDEELEALIAIADGHLAINPDLLKEPVGAMLRNAIDALSLLRTEKAPAPAESGAVAWRCFHCDEVFTDKRCAEMHFGRGEDREAACIIKAGAERSILTALRRAEDHAAEAFSAAHNESTEGWKAYHDVTRRLSEQVRAAEELGFERGLAAHPPSVPGAVKEGWKLVPVEPTKEMIEAMENAFWNDDPSMQEPIAPYRAMLAASPSPASETE